MPLPLSAVLLTIQVVAGRRTIELSPRRPANAVAKLDASKIDEIDKREMVRTAGSAEARIQVLSFFFMFVVGVQLKSPESALKTDIYFAFLTKRWLEWLVARFLWVFLKNLTSRRFFARGIGATQTRHPD